MGGERLGQDAEAREVEEIMRAAEAKGHDPERVARALDYGARTDAAPGPDPTVEVKDRPVLARLFAGSLARRR